VPGGDAKKAAAAWLVPLLTMGVSSQSHWGGACGGGGESGGGGGGGGLPFVLSRRLPFLADRGLPPPLAF
jgi:hypothetical protein